MLNIHIFAVFYVEFVLLLIEKAQNFERSIRL